MESLNLPSFEHRLIQRDGKTMIFDVFRKIYVVLSPEEWVRQHFLMWLVNQQGYPSGLIAVEKPLKYNQLQKRADAVVYNKNGHPLMLIECKAPGIKISQKTFEQAATYNFIFQTKFLVLTNGLEHYCCKIDLQNKEVKFLESVPPFSDIAELV